MSANMAEVGHEYTVTFASEGWYAENRERLHSIVTNWQSFRKEGNSGEIWLQSADSSSSWEYDVRLFWRPTDIFIEVSSFTAVWHRDVRRLLGQIAQETECELRDDDGAEVSLGDRRDEFLKHFPTLLSRWRGGAARMYALTVSHPTLKIRVVRPDAEGHLTIACLDPQHIRGPVRWDNAAIEVLKSEHSGESEFVVRDTEANVEIETAWVEIAEVRRPPSEL